MSALTPSMRKAEEGIWPLLAVERFGGPIWEPACGNGAMARVLQAGGHSVLASDLVNRGHGETGVDFLLEWTLRAPNIVTNPPFKLAAAFVRQAARLKAEKLCLLLRLAFLEGQERAALFRDWPPCRIWVFSTRLSMWRGGIRTSEAGGAIAFAWFVWERGVVVAPAVGWIEPRMPEAGCFVTTATPATTAQLTL